MIKTTLKMRSTHEWGDGWVRACGSVERWRGEGVGQWGDGGVRVWVSGEMEVEG